MSPNKAIRETAEKTGPRTRAAGRKLLSTRLAFLCLAAFFLVPCFAPPAVGDEVKAKRPESPGEKDFQQGMTLLAEKKYSEAEASFHKAMQADGKFVQPYLGLAALYMTKGDATAAGTYFQKAVAMAPQDAVVQTDWGHYLFFRKRYEEARQAFAKAISADPGAARPHYEMGDLYLLGLRQPEKAAAAYRESLAIEPKNARVRYTLANALAEGGHLDEAQAQLEEAARLDAKNPAMLKSLGDFYLRRGKLDQAQQSYEKASVVDPTYIPARIARGDLFVARKDFDGAIADYKEVLQRAPKATDAMVKIAVLEEKQGHAGEAEQWYRKALDADPKLALASNNLAWLMAERSENPAEALKLAKQTVQRYPKNPNFQDTLAWVLRANKDSAQALLVAKKASALDPKNPQILYHMGVLYEETGKTSLAANSYTHALALANNFDGAVDAQQRLAALKGK